MRVLLVSPLLALLAACATTPGEDRLAERDPLEGFNRGVWAFNRAADKVVIKPATKVYRAVAPKPARRGISRIFANLSEPFSFLNNLLQGKPDRAINSLGRFVVNTTLGVGGLADHATKMGMKPTPEDFGQTLASWGVNGGPYLVLPLLGPSTLRDGVGSGVAQFADPYRIGVREANLTRSEGLGLLGAEVINARSEMIDSGADAFLDTSADPYAAARSAYLQRRRAQILDRDNGDTAPEAAGSDDADLKAAVDELNAEGGTTGGGVAPPPETPEPTPTAGPVPDAPEPR